MIVKASSSVATNIALVDGAPHVFFANFAGLVPHAVATPIPEMNASIAVPADRKYKLKFLAFLGSTQELNGERQGNRLVFSLAKIERSAVAWIEEIK